MTLPRYYYLLLLLIPIFLFYSPLHSSFRSRKVARVPIDPRANATLFMLARNSDVEGAVATITRIEQRFNHKFMYPYVFLNDVPFDDTFKTAIQASTKSKVEFGLISPEHWNQPQWIDEEKAAKSRQKLVQAGVKYGGSVPYRNMCRFNAGHFFQHSLMRKYQWYWRLEPNVQFHCNIEFDPFRFMQENNKTYSFTISTYEIPDTIPSLWSTVREFGHKNPASIAQGNALEFISHSHGQTYNFCHFWSNFEIADMEFWRGDTYQAFFSHLDQSGGFYYERWGDAPVHSIAAALFLGRNQIHFFDEIGYQHDDWSHCPSNPTPQMECTCDPANSFDRDPSSCTRGWNALFW